MTLDERGTVAEPSGKIISSAPAVESFLDPAKSSGFWPEEISSRAEFVEQTERRREQNENIRSLFDSLPRPDMSLEDALAQGFITAEQAEKAYASLSDLLQSGEGYERIILYLPFEILPDANWQPQDPYLAQELARFHDSYMESWKHLLSAHDVRANFVDGDILEDAQQSGTLPRVVKAAHLMPKLIEKGYVSREEAENLAEENDDAILKESIADALSAISGNESIGRETSPEIRPFAAIQAELLGRLSEADLADRGNITEKRNEWLKKQEKKEAIEEAGRMIAAAMEKDDFFLDTARATIASGSNPPLEQALADGIRKSIEDTARIEPAKAREMYIHSKDILLSAYRNGDPESLETLFKTFRRLEQLGIAEGSELQALGIFPAKLDGSFSENLESMKRDIAEIREMVASAESDPELSKYIYPAALIYGSRLKGYGEKSSDIDVAVFIRPGTPFSERAKLQELLREKFNHEKIGGGIVEFWLEEKNGELAVQDFNEQDPTLGGSHWTHVLFGAAWEGKDETMKELRQKLLVPYMKDTEAAIYGEKARNVYLGELERDTLQYRLMHKGYEKFFPPCGGISVRNSDRIDGDSVFWDSGYRQLATKLYLDRVFLPKISE